MIRIRVQLIVVAVALALSACGGGGGGGDNTGGGGNPVTGISITPSTLSFVANHDDANPPPPQTITITALGSGTTYIRFENGTSTGLQCSGATCTFAVQPPDAPYMFVSPASNTGALTFIGCADQFCNSGPVANGRQTVTYTYTVTPGLDVTPGPTVTVNGIEQVPTPSQALTLTNPSGMVRPWHASFTATGGLPAFATLNPASGGSTASPATLNVNLATLPAGTYTGTIAITPDGTPRTVTRNVTYVVSSVLSVGNGLSFVVDASTTSGALQQSVAVTSAKSGVLQWSAEETSPWLALAQTSGDTVATPQLGVSLLPAALEKLPKGIHTADITFTPPGYPLPPFAFSPTTVRVTLDMRLPSADFILPRAVAPNSTGDAYLRGSGFTSLPGTVKFGSTDAASATRVSDTLVRAGMPALASNVYDIDVGIAPNALNLDRSRAQLVVASAAFAGTAVPSNGAKYSLVFDDARQTLYVANVNTLTPGIERLRWNGASWTADSLLVASLRDVAISPSGEELVALRPTQLARINPDTWSIIDVIDIPVNTTTPPPAARSLAAGHDGRWLISLADNGAVYSNVFYYDSLTGGFGEQFACCANGDVRASGDGTAIYLHGNGGLQRYDVAARAFSAGGSGSVVGTNLSVSRDGSRVVVDADRVVGANLSSLGTLVAAETLSTAVVTPDGKRAYGYATTGKLYTFDLDSMMGTTFVAIGAAITLPTPVGTGPVMTTSADGRTVFIAGNSHIVVQPGPP